MYVTYHIIIWIYCQLHICLFLIYSYFLHHVLTLVQPPCFERAPPVWPARRGVYSVVNDGNMRASRRHFALEVPKQFYSFAHRFFSPYFFKRTCWFALIFCNLRSNEQYMTARLPRLAPPVVFLFFRNVF